MSNNTDPSNADEGDRAGSERAAMWSSDPQPAEAGNVELAPPR
jgi:hypothetical protein